MNNSVKKFTQQHGDKNTVIGVGGLLTNTNHLTPTKSRITISKKPLLYFVNLITHTTHRV